MATRRDADQAPRESGQFGVLVRDESSEPGEERYRLVESAEAEAGLPAPRGEPRRPITAKRPVRGVDHDRFFLAEKQPDGTYTVNLTEQGIKTFETALGIANDLGGDTLISPHSTIADIMERTATREELSEVLRSEEGGLLRFLRLLVLRRKLRGSEKPSRQQRAISHIGKSIIVGLFIYWTIQQFAISVQDIKDIPGIIANIPSDILHPTAGLGAIGDKISDAYTHLIMGVIGIHLVYVAARVVKPFARIYRKDQLVFGERPLLRGLNALLRRAARRSRAARARAPA